MSAIGIVEVAPVEELIGIPDGEGNDRALADYVISGLYYLDSDDTATLTKPFEYDGRMIEIHAHTARTGLNFEAPSLARPRIEDLPAEKVGFGQALADAIAFDAAADALEAGLPESIPAEAVNAEIGRILPYLVISGLVPAQRSVIAPSSVEYEDTESSPDGGQNVAAFICMSPRCGSRRYWLTIGED